MTWHVFCHYPSEDIPSTQEENTINILLDEFSLSTTIENNVIEILQQSRVACPALTSYELVQFAASIYSVDRRVRRDRAYDKWTRDLRIHFPVQDLLGWEGVRSKLEEALSFLTGDRWSLEFRTDNVEKLDWSMVPVQDNSFEVVSLLSGGLDSFIGAIEFLEEFGKAAFVGHHARGGVESKNQRRVSSLLQDVYGRQYWMQPYFLNPPKDLTGQVDLHSRSRSFLYLALGTITSSALGASKLMVPENGFISLNVPLTGNRISSWSSRTTHPHFLGLYQEILTGLGIDVQVHTPYRFQTKGEMITKVAALPIFHQGAFETMSCSHTTSQRFEGISPYIHCGKCLPCLVRRSAFYSAGFTDSTEYVTDVTSTHISRHEKGGDDLFALKIAIERWKIGRTIPIFRILDSGPIPAEQNELLGFIGVYQRGMKEVSDFIEKTTWS